MSKRNTYAGPRSHAYELSIVRASESLTTVIITNTAVVRVGGIVTEWFIFNDRRFRVTTYAATKGIPVVHMVQTEQNIPDEYVHACELWANSYGYCELKLEDYLHRTFYGKSLEESLHNGLD